MSGWKASCASLLLYPLKKPVLFQEDEGPFWWNEAGKPGQYRYQDAIHGHVQWLQDCHRGRSHDGTCGLCHIREEEVLNFHVSGFIAMNDWAKDRVFDPKPLVAMADGYRSSLIWLIGRKSVVLDQNLFEIDPDLIIDCKVVYAIFAGKIVCMQKCQIRTL